MATTSTRRSGGIGIAMALFLIFLVLKLTGLIDWSWWWVTAPLWVSFLVGFIGGLIAFSKPRNYR